jgi:ribulose-phosphate 3-epimerase
MNPIIPTVFAHNKREFNKKFNVLINVSNNLQIDFMDGKFVKAKSISLSSIPSLKKYKINFEAHLMVSDPEKHISKLKQKGFKKIIFHLESQEHSYDVEELIKKIKKHKLEPMIAINPETKVERVLPFLLQIKGVLFMGVHPGREHQKFINKVYKKIKLLKKIHKKTKVQIDGGANPGTIKKLAKMGVDYINSGSYISESKNPKGEFKKLSLLHKKYYRK